MYRDRREAGQKLATMLAGQRDEHPVVLGLARGGVPVAAEVARSLDADLDVLVVRKVGAPGHPEFAIGAIAPGTSLINDALVQQLGVSQAYLARVIAEEVREMARRERVYRGDRPALELRDRTVILVDDGLATGASAQAAITSVRRRAPRQVIFAAPVCSRDGAAALGAQGTAVVCAATPPDFRAVSRYYEDFAPTSDDEVIACLERSRSKTPSKEGAHP